ncbi:hypothetical protein CVT26_010222 [Gymnopilus dilepis]|uniref:C2H2-type domain-containing protein n=1 Tax=Gymnopilus dilepis TaxID=231916 RepID=A0A409Y161_9AGAR|nr:hypothetical protein CVT26_010222 [Gymnopilus dilepis]
MDAFGTNHYSQPPQYSYDFEGYFGPLHVQRDSPYTSYGQGLVYSGASSSSYPQQFPYPHAPCYEPNGTHAESDFALNHAGPSNSPVYPYAQGGMDSSYHAGLGSWSPQLLSDGTGMRPSSPTVDDGHQQWTIHDSHVSLQSYPTNDQFPNSNPSYHSGYASMPPVNPSTSASDHIQFQSPNASSSQWQSPHSTPLFDYDNNAIQLPNQMPQRQPDRQRSEVLSEGETEVATASPPPENPDSSVYSPPPDKLRVCLYDGCKRIFDSVEKICEHLHLPEPRGHGISRSKAKSQAKACLWSDCGTPIQGSAFFQHIVYKHLKIRPQCTMCGQDCYRKDKLIEHMRKRHGNQARSQGVVRAHTKKVRRVPY